MSAAANPAVGGGRDARDTAADAAAQLRFVTRGLSDADVAAVTAVIAAALADEASAAEATSPRPASAWERNRRNLRGPLPQAWRNFIA